MPNKFKINPTGTEADSIFKGNWAINNTAANTGGGPSSSTGFYNGAEIPNGGYTIYSPDGVFQATNDTQLLNKLNDLGANSLSASAALNWAAGQSNIAVLNEPIENIVTNGLILNLDVKHVCSFVNSEPTTNLIPNPAVNALPTTGNGWGTYNTNQYCGNNGCAVHWDIPAIASVSNNIVTTVSAHQIRSFDVITPLTSGGGVSGGAQYLAKKISNTQFSLHAYNSSQDGSQGYLNPTTGKFKVHDAFWLDQRVGVNSSSFPTKWFGNPHQPNSALVKEIITGGFSLYGHPATDCIRLHWFRADATDGMSYNVDASVTIGQPVTTSFSIRAASVSAVGQHIAFQHYNYGGVAGASGFFMNAFTGAHGEWVRCSFTFTPTHNSLISYWFPNRGDMKIDVANIQIEQNTGLTPFVAGTRLQNNTWYDLSGNNNATLVNGVTAYLNNNLSFDGTDDYINCGNAPEFNITRAVTMELWFKVTSFGSPWTNIFGKMNNDGDSNTRCYSAFINSSGFVHLTTFDGAGQEQLDSTNFITPGEWYHWTGVIDRDAGIIKQYVNGALNTSAGIRKNNIITNTETLKIGYAGNYYQKFNGEVSISRLYNKVLTQEQVTQNFNAQKTRYGL